MQHVLDVNRHTSLEFVKKAQQFINLPKSLFECDVQKCNPKIYSGPRGKAAIRRAKKALVIVRRIEKDLEKLKKLLA